MDDRSQKIIEEIANMEINNKKFNDYNINEFADYLLNLDDEKYEKIISKLKKNKIMIQNLYPFFNCLVASKYYVQNEDHYDVELKEPKAAVETYCKELDVKEEYKTKLKNRMLKKINNGNNGGDIYICVVALFSIFPTNCVNYSGEDSQNGFNSRWLQEYKDKKLLFLLKKNINRDDNSTGYKNYLTKINTNTYWKKNETILKILFGLNNAERKNIEMSETNKSSKENIETLIDNGAKQIIFTGAPGTGKTYTAKQIAEQMIGERKASAIKDNKPYEFVQFHPSYDYTDFVEGLRPVKIDGKIEFVKIDGIFKKFCRDVAEKGNEEKKYFFIIDEINRADLSKVFGELMYCLESDKRGEENKVNTQYQNIDTYYKDNEKGWIPYDENKDVFKDGFYIPKNVIIIGTMNDIDRSVESMDFALRRRFEWIEFKVDDTMLKAAFEAEDKKDGKIYGEVIADHAEDIAERVMRLNNKVIGGDKGKSLGLNRHYYISQGQFANLKDRFDENTTKKYVLDYVWNYKIKSLLEEYVRGEDEDKVGEFIAACRTAFIPESNDSSKIDE